MQLRRIIETRGHFPSDEALLKLPWLALRKICADKVRSAYDWKVTMNQLAFMYGERSARVTA
jgi:transposase-like protein